MTKREARIGDASSELALAFERAIYIFSRPGHDAPPTLLMEARDNLRVAFKEYGMAIRTTREKR